jgi:hypothetical protein
MPGVKIEVKLPNGRKQAGVLSIKGSGGKVLLADIRVLGRADRKTAAAHKNATGDQTKLYGDTPAGAYQVTQIFSTGAGTDFAVTSYGPNGAIRLEPTGGAALTAKLNGRTGLLIHGGRDKGDGKLVPTNGCLRVSDADMARLIKAIVAASENAAQSRCEVVDVSVGVAEAAPDQGVDDGDPPPVKAATTILP